MNSSSINTTHLPSKMVDLFLQTTNQYFTVSVGLIFITETMNQCRGFPSKPLMTIIRLDKDEALQVLLPPTYHPKITDFLETTNQYHVVAVHLILILGTRNKYHRIPIGTLVIINRLDNEEVVQLLRPTTPPPKYFVSFWGKQIKLI